MKRRWLVYLFVYLMTCGNGGGQPRFHVCNNCTFILRHKMAGYFIIIMVVTCASIVSIAWWCVCVTAHCIVWCMHRQVKVHLRWRLKLMSVMTSQGRICVQCVTNGLQGKIVWPNTENYTLEWCILVFSVRKSFHHIIIYVVIWIFIQVNTNVQYVANVVEPVNI